jgi:hypothetical protein
MGRKPKVQTRLEEETYEDFETYRDSRGLSDAEAARDLIGAGLDAEPLRVDEWDSEFHQMMAPVQYVGGAIVALSLLAIVTAQFSTITASFLATAGAAGIGGAIGGSLR